VPDKHRYAPLAWRLLDWSAGNWQRRLALLCFALGLALLLGRVATGMPALTAGAGEPATVIRAVDGDTLDVRIGDQVEKVRLLGVNTPESVDPRKGVECYGKEASAYTASLVQGVVVRLEADPSQADRDKYGRLLRYVWLPDGRLLNYELVAQGYALEATYGAAYREQTRFRTAEASARQGQRGLWAPQACAGRD
jgi:micrococcal nuclease